MQLTTPNVAAQPPIPALPPQVIRAIVQPPAAPAITPRAIDAGEQGHKGNMTGSATQKGQSSAAPSAARKSGRGSQIDVLI